MTDFLTELEVQLTAAAHQAVAERARPPRPKRWPTVGIIAVAALAVGVMILMPARGQRATDQAATSKAASLRHARIGVIDTIGVDGLATSAATALAGRGAVVSPSTSPPNRGRKRSTVYFAKGHASQARSVMRALGIDRAGSPPPPTVNGTAPYDVAVLLGHDFATPAKRLLDGFALLREATNRTLDTPAGPVRVVATQAGLCLQLRDTGGWGGSCFDIADALAGKAVFSLRDPRGRLRGAVGLVPDGVDAVELETSDGTMARRLPVGRNVWAVGAEQIVSARFGGTTIRVP
jgi:hypothetical protein